MGFLLPKVPPGGVWILHWRPGTRVTPTTSVSMATANSDNHLIHKRRPSLTSDPDLRVPADDILTGVIDASEGSIIQSGVGRREAFKV